MICYDAYARTIIGVALLKKEISVHQSIRGCSCDLKDLTTKFCPNCGAVMYQKIFAPLEAFNMDEEKFYEFDILDHNDREIFVGKALNKNGVNAIGGRRHAYQLAPGEYETTREALRARLEPMKLWNPNTYAIWTVLEENC